MILMSWNVNGLRAALKNGFMEWFQSVRPDILCLQETRALPDELPPEIRAPEGYYTYWNPAAKRGYSGTALFTKIEPRSVAPMGDPEFDSEGRVQVADFDWFCLINGYWPNSQEERRRIDYKVRFCEAVGDLADRIRQSGKHVILTGDFNIAHQPIDLARPKENENSAGYYIEEREAMSRFLARGYADTFRRLHPDRVEYSWWFYRGGARARNVGWRIDYFCVDEALMKQVKNAWICGEVTGSDHCPVALELEAPRKAGKRNQRP
ncbi:MAG TPA: exodeoxyribonuclease III [Candidatus Hydrogenedentes bacterium]|nr:exodeoxyribonuclease III [Candidatus Hydrogenedentota bacterium]